MSKLGAGLNEFNGLPPILEAEALLMQPDIILLSQIVLLMNLVRAAIDVQQKDQKERLAAGIAT